MKRNFLIQTITVLLTGVAFLLAQSANDAVRIVQDEIGFGARALGMGGAYVATADDYTSIYWNPGGLASVKKTEFFAELSQLNFNNKATFANQLTNESQNFTRLRSLGLAIPLPTLRGSMVLGIGYNRVRDFDRSLTFSGFNTQSNGLAFDLKDNEDKVKTYFFDRNVYQTEQVTDEGGLSQWSFSGAIAVSPNFDVGVTMDIWRGQDDYQLTFLQEDRDNIYNDNNYPANFSRYQVNQSLLTKYSAIGFRVGGILKLNPGIRLGGAIGIPTTFTVNETYSSSDELVFDDGFTDQADLGEGEFEYKVQTPFYFDGGISFSNKVVTLGGSVRYRDWTQTKFKVPNDAQFNPDNAALLEENKVIRRDYRATLQYRVGGEIFLEGMKTRLRGGYAYFPSPFKNASTDLDKKYLTFGLGFYVDQYVRLDIAYLRGKWKQESEDIYTPGGTLEDITVNKILVGFSYQF